RMLRIGRQKYAWKIISEKYSQLFDAAMGNTSGLQKALDKNYVPPNHFTPQTEINLGKPHGFEEKDTRHKRPV
ncbi:MAG: hypothetical protein ACR2P6_06310, partial [Gammaproteobacteria bacterium]